MDQESKKVCVLSWVAGSVALGALAMFFLDPDRGRRRRALARDKMYSAAIRTRKCIDKKSHYLAGRAKGLRAEVSHMMP